MIPPWVEPYIGIPFVEGGRSVADDGGLDCWGLVTLIYREHYGIELPSYDGPYWKKGAQPDEIGAALESYAERYQPVAAGAEREGDGIILRMRGSPLHVGLVIAPGWMIHTHESAAVCIENYRGMAWSRRVIGFHRHV